MLASARLDAAVCLRCQLRRTLQQIASASCTRLAARTCPCPVQRQFRQQSTAAVDPAQLLPRVTEAHSRGTKHFHPHGRIRGRKGREHREASESLEIDSLGRPSEVIVLRDVPTAPRKARQERETPAADKDLTQAPSLTSHEIQAMLSKSGRTPKEDEVNAAIEEARPAEDVVTKAKFESVARTLHDSYNFRQLQHYLQLQLGNHTDTLPSRAQRSSTSKAPRNVTVLERVPWQVRINALTTSKPIFPGALITPSATAKLPRKQVVVNRILRQAWQIRIEEEAEALGTLSLLLTPAQWTLLQTSTSSKLFNVLRSDQFHKNSQLERDAATNSLCIIGPRGEAEDIASLVEAALQNAKTRTIDLCQFKYLLTQPVDHTTEQQAATFGRVFTWDRLSTIMGVTKTSIVLDEANEELSVHSLRSDTLQDALRMLVALLHLPLRRSYDSSTWFASQTPKTHLLPVATSRNLPMAIRSDDLARLGTPEEKLISHRQLRLKDIPPKGLHDFAERMLASRGPDIDHAPVAKSQGDSYWQSKPTSSVWQPTLGLVLHQHGPGSPLSLKQLQNPRYRPVHFAAQAPSLTNLLSHYKRLAPLGTAGDPLGRAGQVPTRGWHFPHTRLVARFIPDPFKSQTSGSAVAYPKVKLIFEILDTSQPATRVAVDHSTTFAVDKSTCLKVEGLQAELHEHVFDMLLPEAVSDVRLVKREILRASVADALNDPVIKAFVQGIIHNMQSGDDLRAGQMLSLEIPKWTIRQERSGDGEGIATSSPLPSVGQTETVAYMFTGFEHNERRRFRPVKSDDFHKTSDDHLLQVDDIEAGLSGGKRTEVSIIPGSPDNAAGQKTVPASVSEHHSNLADTTRVDTLSDSDVPVGLPEQSPLESDGAETGDCSDTSNATTLTTSGNEAAERANVERAIRAALSLAKLADQVHRNGVQPRNVRLPYARQLDMPLKDETLGSLRRRRLMDNRDKVEEKAVQAKRQARAHDKALDRRLVKRRRATREALGLGATGKSDAAEAKTGELVGSLQESVSKDRVDRAGG